MSKATRSVIEQLESNGYVALTKEQSLSKLRIAHCVYVLLDDSAVYFHSAHAPMAALKRFQSYMTKGNVNCLPVPVQNYFNWKLIETPTSKVVMYYRTGMFINGRLENSLLAIPGLSLCTRKPRDNHSLKNVYRFSLEGIPGYMLVSSKEDINTASSAWLTRASQTCCATHNPTNIRFRNWCVKNAGSIRRSNLVAETLAEGLLGGAADLFMSLHANALSNHPHLCLNQRLVNNA